MGPITHSLDQPVFDRIEMDVIDMPREVAVISDGVLPKSPLPKPEIAISKAFEIEARLNQGGAKMSLDSPPPAREIRIIWRQRKNGMQMVGKNRNSADREGPLSTSHAESRT